MLNVFDWLENPSPNVCCCSVRCTHCTQHNNSFRKRLKKAANDEINSSRKRGNMISVLYMANNEEKYKYEYVGRWVLHISSDMVAISKLKILR